MTSSPLFTCSDIARTLKRNPVSTWRAVQRLQILPSATIGNGKVKLYDSAAVERIRIDMRAPNRAK